MNKKLITIGLISGTGMFTGIGIVFPELSVGIGSDHGRDIDCFLVASFEGSR